MYFINNPIGLCNLLAASLTLRRNTSRPATRAFARRLVLPLICATILALCSDLQAQTGPQSPDDEGGDGNNSAFGSLEPISISPAITELGLSFTGSRTNLASDPQPSEAIEPTPLVSTTSDISSDTLVDVQPVVQSTLDANRNSASDPQSALEQSRRDVLVMAKALEQERAANAMLNLELDAFAELLVDRDQRLAERGGGVDSSESESEIASLRQDLKAALDSTLQMNQAVDGARAELVRMQAEREEQARKIEALELALIAASNDLEQREQAQQSQEVQLVVVRQELGRVQTELASTNQTLANQQRDIEQVRLALDRQRELTATREAELTDIKMILEETQDMLALAQGTGPDRVNITMAKGVDDAPLTGLRWAVQRVNPQDGSLSSVFMSGGEPSFHLPSEPGVYRVTATLGAEQRDQTFAVSPFAQRDHGFDLGLARIDFSPIQLSRQDARVLVWRAETLIEEFAANDDTKSLFVRPGTYDATLVFGANQVSQQIAASVGETTSVNWDFPIKTIDMTLVYGEGQPPLPSYSQWSVRAIDPAPGAAPRTGSGAGAVPSGVIAQGQGGAFTLDLLPGTYQLQFGHDGFSETMAFTISRQSDDQQSMSAVLTQGDVAVDITNDSMAFPAGLPVQWTIEDGEGRLVGRGAGAQAIGQQLRVGSYRLIAVAANEVRERPFVVVAGQSAVARLDFDFGRIEAQLNAVNFVGDQQTTWVLTRHSDGRSYSFATDGLGLSEYVPAGEYQAIVKLGDQAIQSSVQIRAGQVLDVTLIIGQPQNGTP